MKTRKQGPVPDFCEGPVMEKKTASRKSKSSPEGRGAAKDESKTLRRTKLRKARLDSETEDLEDDVEIIEEPTKKTKEADKATNRNPREKIQTLPRGRYQNQQKTVR
ncbi:hypothetical protein CYLTODRAFT_460425 [Cylindrobasidium torrendii FP15055 ss-10]|uniref:Uncharacterized protein n=1 Tax=Cylindrobasidium torrendii FP15055 ss-10 TaxID=1314674 RepID=A0A0D7AR11_9AGAR|nr:hypothetical protein CYLTODRAFT_460425 [Cylindrobasidium torrendii FP15055 ss-10]